MLSAKRLNTSMSQHKTRNIVLGLLAGGAAIWGFHEAFDPDTSTAATQSHNGGGHGTYFGHSFWGGGSSVGRAINTVRGGFGATGGHGSGS